MDKFMRWSFSITIALFYGTLISLNAAPLNGDSFDLEQPDGSTVPVLVWGDEFYQHVESPDGFTLMRNKKTGWICYAELSEDSSELIPTDSVYHYPENEEKLQDSGSVSTHSRHKHVQLNRKHRLRSHEKVRTKLLDKTDTNSTLSTPLPAPSMGGDRFSIISPLPGVTPVTGEYKGLTILIDFSDKKSTIPIDSVMDFLNKRGYTGYGNNGSVRDYFYDVSGGKVDYQNIVVGYYRAKNAKTYYDNSSVSFGTRAQELIKEALNWLKSDGFDFSTLSSDSRKYITAVNILYSGSPSMGWSEGLWPHQGTLSGFSADGYSVRKYQISNLGSSLGIGTFCHENGHMLFKWPDLYDYGGESSGVGQFCIMCSSGSKNPVPPCAYLRDYSGWDMVTDITDMVSGTVFSYLVNSNTSYIYRNKSNSKEMFYIEGRKRTGRNKTLPDSGFMIWHVDRNGSNNNEQRTSSTHYLVSLEQADNAFDLERARNNGGKGDLFRAGYKNRFDDETTPAALWWNGSKSGMKIWNMSGVADTMTFSIGEIATTTYSIIASAGEHGRINPSGKIQVAAGSTVRIAVIPDSGYQIDVIKVNGNTIAVIDTVVVDKINADQVIAVEFGLKSALVLRSPEEDEILYSGDMVSIAWRNRGLKVQGFELSYSKNGGKTFTSIIKTLSPEDSTYSWTIPDIEGDSCVIKIADTDGTPASQSGLFVIRKKPVITFSDKEIKINVEKGKSLSKNIPVTNTGTGKLSIRSTTSSQMKKVMINELSIGADAQAPDAIEIRNVGTDIDLSGWKLSWEDNKATSGSYVFPNGFILKGGAVFQLSDIQNDTGVTSAYLGQNVQWLFSDFLEMSVTLTDPSGRGIDFVKTAGSPDLPPEGTSWLGKGIDLCTSFVYRDNNFDSDSAMDWKCSGKGTLKQVNGELQKGTVSSLLSLFPLNGEAAGSSAVSMTLSVDATRLEPGTYEDEVVIYHNDPTKPSPLKIPCVITVTEPVSVISSRKTISRESGDMGQSHLVVAPNPVQSGQKINLQYMPQGNERTGELFIYNNIGDCIYREKVNFTGINIFNRKPLQIFWQPQTAKGLLYRNETFLVRLMVKKSDGTSSIISAKIGVR